MQQVHQQGHQEHSHQWVATQRCSSGGPEAARKHLKKVGPLVNAELGIDIRLVVKAFPPSSSGLLSSLLNSRGLKICDAGDVAMSTLEEGHESLATLVGKIISQGKDSIAVQTLIKLTVLLQEAYRSLLVAVMISRTRMLAAFFPTCQRTIFSLESLHQSDTEPESYPAGALWLPSTSMLTSMCVLSRKEKSTLDLLSGCFLKMVRSHHGVVVDNTVIG